MTALREADAAIAATKELLTLFLLQHGGLEDRFAAIHLQRAVDDYFGEIDAIKLGLAPAYPSDWLVKRAMDVVRHFQEGVDGSMALETWKSRWSRTAQSWAASRRKNIGMV